MEKNAVSPRYELIIIGGSAGSLEVIMHLVRDLPRDFSIPILIVLHRKSEPGNLLQELLSEKTSLEVREAEDKEIIEKRKIYIAPVDYHLLIEQNHGFSLDVSEKIHFSRPSIDVSFSSAADVFKSSLIGILLSGANADGAEGLMDIKDAGGLTIVQDPNSAEISFMPQQAIAIGAAEMVLKEEELIKFICGL